MAEEITKDFDIGLLSDEQKSDYKYVRDRILELQEANQDHYGVNLDELWEEADKDYIPHRLKTRGKKVIVTDEDKGWRSNMVELGRKDWQSDIAQNNPFIKIQIAMSILVDQNPGGVFSAYSKKYQDITPLIKQLYQRSWEYARSKGQLKLFIFNLAKYGWAAARTYPLKIERKVKTLVEYNEEDPSKSVYEEKTVVEYNDVFRENLDVRNVWIDDMAKPNNSLSVRDWTWRKVYDYDDLKEKYGNYPWFKYVKKQAGITSETIKDKDKNTKKYQGKNLVECYFYENKQKDMFVALFGGIDGVPVIMEPLPIENANGVKKLSLWQTYWLLRHSESTKGIGIWESIRFDKSLLDRILNMSIDQLTLAIYKMFFYQGTQNLNETGEITIKPGVGKQVIDPSKINWVDVPGPGSEVVKWIEMFKQMIDESSGITDPLIGNVVGKTAFEIAQAKESALKRLKNPFDNILEALNDEGYITIAVMNLIYSIPEIREITDEETMRAYLDEIENDKDLYEMEDTTDEYGNPGVKMKALIYREFPLNFDTDDKGNLIETNQTKFFRVKPKFLAWDGVINIKAQSLLTPSKQVEKALDLEFWNMFIPLLTQLDQERQLYLQQQQLSGGGGQGFDIDNLPHGKAAKQLAKLYDKDPRDVFPDDWMEEGPDVTEPQQMQPPQLPPQLGQPQGQPPVPGQQPGGPQDLIIPSGQPQAQAPQADTFVGQTELPSGNPTSIAGKVMQRLTQPFRKT